MQRQQSLPIASRLLVLLLLIAPAQGWAKRRKPAASEPAEPKLEDCLRSKTCLKLVEEAFTAVFFGMLSELEGAEPDRFFPGVVTYAEKGLDDQGHFVRFDCLGGLERQRACSEANRDDFEERVMSVALLRSVPLGDARLERYFHPRVWTVTPLGLSTIRRIQQASPGLMGRLAAIAAGRGPRKKEGVEPPTVR